MRGVVAAALAMVGLVVTAPILLAGTRYEVKGETIFDAAPDAAKLVVPLSSPANGMTDDEWRNRVATAELVQRFRDAGAEDISVKETSDDPLVLPSIDVRVSDFSMLPNLSRIATEARHKGWTVFYSLDSRPRFAMQAEEAALAVAKEKAILEAQRRGLKSATLVTVEKAQTCFSLLQGVPDDCVVEGEEDSGVVIVTAWKPNPSRTDFSVPKPWPEKLTATVDAVFELE